MPNKVYASDISVSINNRVVDFSGQRPTNVDGRTLVPIREVFETLGFGVEWNGVAREITLTRDTHVVVVTIDSGVFMVNGQSQNLDVPAQVLGGSTMLPLRAVLESIGYELGWDSATATVMISTSQAVSAHVNQPHPQASVQFSVSEAEQRALALINADRIRAGLNPLVWSDSLAMVSREHSEDQARNSFSQLAAGVLFMQLQRAGFPSDGVGITGTGNRTPEAFVGGLGRSGQPIHLNERTRDFTHGGVGFAYSEVGFYWTIRLSTWTSPDAAFMPESYTTNISPDEFERKVIELANIVRFNNGATPLQLDYSLSKAARAHSEDLARVGSISHTGTDGSTLLERASRAGWNEPTAISENVGGGFTPEAAMNRWLNSPPHRANIINETFTHAGVGVAKWVDASGVLADEYVATIKLSSLRP